MGKVTKFPTNKLVTMDDVKYSAEQLHKKLGIGFNLKQILEHGFWTLPVLHQLADRIKRLEDELSKQSKDR